MPLDVRLDALEDLVQVGAGDREAVVLEADDGVRGIGREGILRLLKETESAVATPSLDGFGVGLPPTPPVGRPS